MTDGAATLLLSDELHPDARYSLHFDRQSRLEYTERMLSIVANHQLLEPAVVVSDCVTSPLTGTTVVGMVHFVITLDEPEPIFAQASIAKTPVGHFSEQGTNLNELTGNVDSELYVALPLTGDAGGCAQLELFDWSLTRQFKDEFCLSPGASATRSAHVAVLAAHLPKPDAAPPLPGDPQPSSCATPARPASASYLLLAAVVCVAGSRLRWRFT